MIDPDLQKYDCRAGPLLCPAFFGDGNVQKTFLLSFTIAFVSYFVQYSWHPLLDLYGACLGFLWGFHHNSMKSLWHYGVSIGFQKDVHGISMGFL